MYRIKYSNETQNHSVNFPLIAGEGKYRSELCDLIHLNRSDSIAVRPVFIIILDKKVKLPLPFSLSIGINFGALLCIIDTLQYTAKDSVAIPANSNNSDIVVISNVVVGRFCSKISKKKCYFIKPYLRSMSEPDKQ